MNDFTFSDGTFIPKGSNLAVTTRAINHDEVTFLVPGKLSLFQPLPSSHSRVTILTLKNFKDSAS